MWFKRSQRAWRNEELKKVSAIELATWMLLKNLKKRGRKGDANKVY